MSEKRPIFDHRIIELVNNYLEGNTNPETKVTLHLPPEELGSRIDLTLPEHGCTLEELYNTIEQYLEFSVRTGQRQFFNQL